MTKKSTGNKKSKTSFSRKVFISFVVITVTAGIIFGTDAYIKLFKANVNKRSNKEYLYIPTGSTFEDVMKIIRQDQVLRNSESFAWVAEKMNYTEKVKPGKYKLDPKMSNMELVKMLRSGRQEPVKLMFNNLRLKSDFAGYISRNLEIDSLEFLNLLNDDAFLDTFDLKSENVYTMFIPNTYEFYWNTNQEKFFSRMNDEYKKFWNEKRMGKAKALHLNPIEVSILASIVDQEALVNSEMPRIAGVYLNRMRKNMKLEADPTVIFANGDFSVQRVIGKLLMKDSPYNTYMYKGLPPGPIAMPSIAAIDAVLNAEKHNYIYFCAKEDFSGYHNFASTFSQHKLNARKFQKALNARNIRR
jgi:UPF0755 protein